MGMRSVTDAYLDSLLTTLVCCVGGSFIRAKRVSNLYIPKKKSVCSTNFGFCLEKINLGFSVGDVLCTRFVCTWYQPSLHSPQLYRERDAPRQRAAATRRRETDEARPLGYLSVAVVASLLAHSSSSRKVRRARYRP